MTIEPQDRRVFMKNAGLGLASTGLVSSASLAGNNQRPPAPTPRPASPIPLEMRRFPAGQFAEALLGAPDRNFAQSWQNAPHNRVIYQQLSRLLPMAVVWRGRGTVEEFEEDRENLNTIRFRDHRNRQKSVEQWLPATFTDGLLVLKDGEIVTENYFNGMRSHIRHHLMSASKSLVGTLAGNFVARRQINPTNRVSHYVAALRRTAWNNITLRQVLDMMSDVQYREEFNNPRAEVWQHESAVGWRNVGRGNPRSNREFLTRMRKFQNFDNKFHYRSSETDIVAWVLEEVSGIGLAELFSREIWSKLGCEEDAQCTVDRTGECIGMGGFGATLRDCARFGQMMLQDGFFNGQQIVPARWVRACRSGNVANFVHYRTRHPNGAYRNQWWIHDNRHGIYAAVGYAGQYIYINPPANVVIVKHSTYDRPNINYLKDDFAAFDAMAGELSS